MLRWLGEDNPDCPLILTVPHSGEQLPPEADWLARLPDLIQLTDVDRFVDDLYEPVVRKLKLPLLMTEVHRYAVDLNRFPEDVDQDSVVGAASPSGAFPKGFHWVMTTQGDRLMPAPMPEALHRKWVREYHDAFHGALAERLSVLRSRFPGQVIYHLDCHSMPSEGTGAHADAGEKRADVVISDVEGKSARAPFKDLVIEAFRSEGLQVSYNWPYKGGRMTQRYGRPAEKHETIQIELNRALYMDERTKAKLPEFDRFSSRLASVVERILVGFRSMRS